MIGIAEKSADVIVLEATSHQKKDGGLTIKEGQNIKRMRENSFIVLNDVQRHSLI